MKLVIDEVFSAVIEYLMEEGYVKLEQYFQAEYGDDDLEELGGNDPADVNAAGLKKKIAVLN